MGSINNIICLPFYSYAVASEVNISVRNEIFIKRQPSAGRRTVLRSAQVAGSRQQSRLGPRPGAEHRDEIREFD